MLFFYEFCKPLKFNGLQIARSLTANFGEKSSRFLLSIFKISPQKMRSNNFGIIKIHEKS